MKIMQLIFITAGACCDSGSAISSIKNSAIHEFMLLSSVYDSFFLFFFFFVELILLDFNALPCIELVIKLMKFYPQNSGQRTWSKDFIIIENYKDTFLSLLKKQ